MFDTKIAIVVREDLLTWQKLNVTAFLTSGVLGADKDLIGALQKPHEPPGAVVWRQRRADRLAPRRLRDEPARLQGDQPRAEELLRRRAQLVSPAHVARAQLDVQEGARDRQRRVGAQRVQEHVEPVGARGVAALHVVDANAHDEVDGTIA